MEDVINKNRSVTFNDQQNNHNIPNNINQTSLIGGLTVKEENSGIGSVVFNSPLIKLKDDKVDMEATRKVMADLYDENQKFSLCDIINMLCL